MQKNTNIDKKIPVTMRVTGDILKIKVSNSGGIIGVTAGNSTITMISASFLNRMGLFMARDIMTIIS